MKVHRDLARNTFVVLCIVALMGLSGWILRPFLAAAIWAAMLVVATWPLLSQLERFFGGRRPPAILILCLCMLLGLVMPLWLAADTLFEYSDTLTAQARFLSDRYTHAGLPPPPVWMKSLPWVGPKLELFWLSQSADGGQQLAAKIWPYATEIGKWVLAQIGSLGGLLLQFLMVVAIAAVFYAQGEQAGALLRRFGARLAGLQGEEAVILAGQAIRAVALGVGLTAIVQTLLGALALWLAGMPLISLLAALMLILCIAQVGPAPVLLPAAFWFFWHEQNLFGSLLLGSALLAGALDNVLRPVLIRRGADLPMLLIFIGVVGGLLSFGLIGIFVGPVVLAVSWTLLQAWMAHGR